MECSPFYASLTLWGDSSTGQTWKITSSGAESLVLDHWDHQGDHNGTDGLHSLRQ
jgi:hypothetical protein